MTRLLVAVTLSSAVLACGPKHSSSGGGDDRCAKTSAHAYVAGEGRAAPGSRERQITVDAMADACRKDRWSDDAIACLDKSDDLKEDPNHCEDKFTAEQKSHLEEAFEAGKRQLRQEEEQNASSSGGATETTSSASGGAASADGSDKLTSEDTAASLEIAKGIVNLLSQLNGGYKDLRGDVLQQKDGDTVYAVKNTSFMHADEELIMIKSGGSAFYLATYSGSKKIAMSFSAFTGGVAMVTGNDGNFAAQGASSGAGNEMTFFLTFKGQKVGKYTVDKSKNEGTLIIGVM